MQHVIGPSGAGGGSRGPAALAEAAGAWDAAGEGAGAEAVELATAGASVDDGRLPHPTSATTAAIGNARCDREHVPETIIRRGV